MSNPDGGVLRRSPYANQIIISNFILMRGPIALVSELHCRSIVCDSRSFLVSLLQLQTRVYHVPRLSPPIAPISIPQYDQAASRLAGRDDRVGFAPSGSKDAWSAASFHLSVHLEFMWGVGSYLRDASDVSH